MKGRSPEGPWGTTLPAPGARGGQLAGLPTLAGAGRLSGMTTPDEHRRRIEHSYQPGDLHKLTLSCYRRLSPVSLFTEEFLGYSGLAEEVPV